MVREDAVEERSGGDGADDAREQERPAHEARGVARVAKRRLQDKPSAKPRFQLRGAYEVLIGKETEGIHAARWRVRRLCMREG